MRDIKVAISKKNIESAAARLGETIPLARLHPRVIAWIEDHAPANQPWVVTVSGGADSIALLLLLWVHFPKMRKKLLVLHYDHATRPDSAVDAKFVCATAKKLGLRCIQARRAPGGPASEAVLRELRCEFFRVASNEHGVGAMFFGHQRDDITETMLMRLARGSGAGGLTAPRPVREFPDGIAALRPLLNIDRGELRAALRDAGGAWREDSSNDTDDYLRNRLRRHVLPLWREVTGGRDLDAGVARSRALLEEDDEALEASASALVLECARGQSLDLTLLQKQPRAVWRRVLHRWLGQNGAGAVLNAKAFDGVLEAAMTARPGGWSAGKGRALVLTPECLMLSEAANLDMRAWEPLPFTPGDTVNLPDGARLETLVVAVDRELRQNLKCGKLDPATQAMLALPLRSSPASFLVRLWQAGDRYQPLGASGRRKLQDVFTDKKIPARERRRLPVVCSSDNEPVWVPGLPPAQTFCVTAATSAAMRLTYCPIGGTIGRYEQIHE